MAQNNLFEDLLLKGTGLAGLATIIVGLFTKYKAGEKQAEEAIVAEAAGSSAATTVTTPQNSVSDVKFEGTGIKVENIQMGSETKFTAPEIPKDNTAKVNDTGFGPR